MVVTPRMTTTANAVLSTPRPGSRGNVPFLPGMSGNSFNKKTTKSQSLAYGQGGHGAMDSIRRDSNDVPAIDLGLIEKLRDPFHRFPDTGRSFTHDERSALKESARNTYQPAVPPAWLKHDRQVLRFYAYFQEPVFESPNETFRVRHCSVLFYLEDGTIMITEPKMENSGIPQGTFVKRHRVPKPQEFGGGFYTYEDLAIGTTLNVYSRSFRIIDADDFTREFYERALGVALQPGSEPPLDVFQCRILEEEERRDSPMSIDVIESKTFHELAMGGSRRNEKLQQYIENDRKVLCFKAYWDDHTRYGSRQFYTLHYYLADDCVEILETKQRNSGKDPWPVFWKKGPMRKNPHVNPAPGMLEPEAIVYRPEDLIIGEPISAYGRLLMLYDCDKFTRDFYREYMNHEQGYFDITEPEPAKAPRQFPPHTGFGTEEDSLASCKALTPRPPRRDMNKIMIEGERVLRFEANMMNPSIEDKNRKFVVGIFMADDNVGVWEIKQRNSGHGAGKWSNKARKMNPDTGTWFTAKDFYVGAVLEINSTPFQLTAADKGALNYLEERKYEYPVADAKNIVAKISDLGQVLRAEFLDSGAKTCPATALGAVAERNGTRLVEHELLTLTRAYGTDPEAVKLGNISVEGIVNAIEAFN